MIFAPIYENMLRLYIVQCVTLKHNHHKHVIIGFCLLWKILRRLLFIMKNHLTFMTVKKWQHLQTNAKKSRLIFCSSRTIWFSIFHLRFEVNNLYPKRLYCLVHICNRVQKISLNLKRSVAKMKFISLKWLR